MQYHVGFSGTQDGMTDHQIFAFVEKVKSIDEKHKGEQMFFHEGDCKGSDDQATTIIRVAFSDWIIVVHPPIITTKRAFNIKPGDIIRAPGDYLDRNHEIVNESQELIATPKERFEITRSGTWATVRYAREVGIKTFIIIPERNHQR